MKFFFGLVFFWGGLFYSLTRLTAAHVPKRSFKEWIMDPDDWIKREDEVSLFDWLA